jgi:hypothetical protein
MNATHRIVLVGLVTVGCTSASSAPAKENNPRREIVERYRAGVEKTFAAIAKLEAAPLPEVTGKIDYAGPPLTNENAVVLAYGPDVLKHARTGQQSDPMFDAEDLSNIDSMLHGATPDTSTETESRLARFTALRDVVLVKTLVHERPREVDSGFVPGHVVAEAYLFDISGKYLGGVPFEATSSSEVSYTKRLEDGAEVSNDADSQIDADLESNAHKAMRDAIAAQIPNSNLPSD